MRSWRLASLLVPLLLLLPAQASAGTVTLIGAGDISLCDDDHDQGTADVISGVGAVTGVFTLGDNVYPDGSAEVYADCYDPTWGAFKDITRPTPGNHDHVTSGASAYFDYFGALAGPPGRGWYSYDVGAWHIVVLDSACKAVGGCGKGSPQERWLRRDLAAHPAACTMAYWHKPFYSSGEHGQDLKVRQFWTDLLAANVELVLSGHDHDYERFKPQNGVGQVSWKHGIRQFVVGTGGAPPYPLGPIAPNSATSHSGTFGVLRLDLRPESYHWTFLASEGGSFNDEGETRCH